MSWDYRSSSSAIVAYLADALPLVSVYDRPPATFNPPAVILAHPQLVTRNQPRFAVDRVTWPLMCVAGANQADYVADLLDQVAAVIDDDPSLGGEVQSATAATFGGWRITDVSGIQVLAADVTLDLYQ
jgi:hypothetical protein